MEIIVSRGPETTFFQIFFRWLSLGCGELLCPGEGLSGPGHLSLPQGPAVF